MELAALMEKGQQMKTQLTVVKSLKNSKRSKIYASIGPATNSYEMVLEMVKQGVNAFNMNFSHGDYEERKQQTKWIRKASVVCGKPVAIIQDLQGPKIRLGDFEGFLGLEEGQQIRLAYNASYEESGIIPIQYDLSKKVKRGNTMYLYDGKVRATVTNVIDKVIHARVENNGILLKRKGINLPDTDFGGDVITEKDRADVIFGANQDFDYVAMSFIQTSEDAKAMRKFMKMHGYDAKLIAKIETSAAINNIDSIIDEVDAVMIARGDLAYEVTPEAVPVLQRKILGLCRQKGKLSIVATQMLASMTENPEPTRAEVSDVATSVILQADALALRDETANGKFPIEAVKMMKRVILYTESHAPVKTIFVEDEPANAEHTMQGAIASAIITLSDELNATAIVVETKSGRTALEIARRRPARPIIAVTSSERVAQQLAVAYGVKTYTRKDEKEQTLKLTRWLKDNKVLKSGDVIISVSGKYPGVVGTTDTIKVRIVE